MPITLDGINLQNASAPVLFQDCRLPITDLRRYRQPDEVVQNMPTFIGGWADGTIAPALDSQIIDIDTVTNIADACRFPVVSAALTACDWIAPMQKLLGLETEQINWAQLVTRYCTVTNIAPTALRNVFNADGTINQGNPYSLNFVRFVLRVLSQALGIAFTHSAMLGDYANNLQFDGLYTQIDNGWEEGSTACDPALNTGNEINWDALTGGDGTGTASPDAETVESTITLWGQSFDVPAGLTLGDFLYMFAEAAKVNYGQGDGEIAWEMHVPNGYRMSVLRALSCIKFCGIDDAFSDSIMARYERLVSGRMAELWTYGMTFPIFETAYTGANTLRFGPRSIGGTPTYGLVVEDIEQVIRDLNPLGQALYGSGGGDIPGEQEPLLGMTRTQIANRFESRAIHWDFLKISAICVRASMMLKAGLLATDRHMWLKVTNVGVASFRIAPPNDLTIDEAPLNEAPPAAPSLTLLADAATTTDLTPTLTWGAVTNALRYNVQIATSADFGDDVVDAATVTAATYTPTTALADNDTYYWRVRAQDYDGKGAWSAVRSFTVDTTP